MPVYVYEDTHSGQQVELLREVGKRDQVPGHLRRLISPVHYLAGRPNPADTDVATPAALRKLEQEQGTAQVVRDTGFSANQLKRIWNI